MSSRLMDSSDHTKTAFSHQLIRPFARTDRSEAAIWWWQLDKVTFGCAFALMALGILFSVSASPDAAADNRIGDGLYYTKRHLFFVITALIMIVVLSRLSLKGVRRIGLLIYTAALAALVIIAFVGTEAKGGQRWLNLGPFMLQPSEFIKPALVVMTAWLFSQASEKSSLPGVTVAFILYGAVISLLLRQPDIGQSFLITMVFFACFFLYGMSLFWVVLLLVLGGIGSILIYFTQPHFKTRIDEFFSSDGDHHQIDAARGAIANGGLFGEGMNEGTMKAGLPDLHTDFIYSVAAEEFGLLISLIMIGLFAYIVIRNLMAALSMTNGYQQVATAGLSLLIALQVLINISVNIAIIPPKGMTLPLISYGGSSLLAMGVTFGLLLALTRKRQDIMQSPSVPRKEQGAL